MSFNKKRDRLQIIAEILSSCTNPQTQTYIRRQTNLSYTVLHGCITQLLLGSWLLQVENGFGQKKLVTSDKGLLFLEKWVELQKTMGVKKTSKLKVLTLKP